jgi:GDP-L-fucose synthase
MLAIIGANGYLGRALTGRADFEEVPHLALGRADFDLMGNSIPDLQSKEISTIVYCADYYPGLEYCGQHGDEIFRVNTCMYQALFAFAIQNGVKRVITIGTTACYPVTDEPLREDMLDRKVLDQVHPKMRMYAASRYWLFDLARHYEKSHGIAHIHLIVPNIYGPGDKFEPTRSHLLSSWIRDFHVAREERKETIELWGTPLAKRELMYIDDVAYYVYALAQMELGTRVLNIGTAVAPTYGEIAHRILRALDYEKTGRLRWDLSRRNARLSETLDLTRFLQLFPTQPAMPFQRGIVKTVQYYESEVYKPPVTVS